MAPIWFSSICSVSHLFDFFNHFSALSRTCSPICVTDFVLQLVFWHIFGIFSSGVTLFLLLFHQCTKFKVSYQCFACFSHLLQAPYILLQCSQTRWKELWVMTADMLLTLTWHLFYHQRSLRRQRWNSPSQILLEGQTRCTVLYYDNVSNLTFHANEAWMESTFISISWLERHSN